MKLLYACIKQLSIKRLKAHTFLLFRKNNIAENATCSVENAGKMATTARETKNWGSIGGDWRWWLGISR